MIKSEFLPRIKNTWPNEISGNDKKPFYRSVLGFAFDLFGESRTRTKGRRRRRTGS
jgi:hypothetical protein